VVVKVGTSSITGQEGRIDPQRMQGLADAVTAVGDATGQLPVLVSSGAGAAGRERLGLKLPLTLPRMQAAAAVGQALLMRNWEAAFTPMPVAQILLSAGDVHDRRTYVNAKNALSASLKMGAMPVVNENDSVATDELKLGDNDSLSAWVAQLVGADALVILTDVDGLYDTLPSERPFATPLEEVSDLASAMGLAGASHDPRGTGGMQTKLKAAAIARDAGIETWIVRADPHVLTALAQGESHGTRILAPGPARSARKAWIAQQPPRGRLTLDDGALAALAHGKSLLPSGLVSVEGAFEFGDAVDLVGRDGVVRGRGLTNLSADQARRMAGRHSRDMAELLGRHDFDEVVHRDNLALHGGG
jgi:glutamate 5-kinase